MNGPVDVVEMVDGSDEEGSGDRGGLETPRRIERGKKQGGSAGEVEVIDLLSPLSPSLMKRGGALEGPTQEQEGMKEGPTRPRALPIVIDLLSPSSAPHHERRGEESKGEGGGARCNANKSTSFRKRPRQPSDPMVGQYQEQDRVSPSRPSIRFELRPGAAAMRRSGEEGTSEGRTRSPAAAGAAGTAAAARTARASAARNLNCVGDDDEDFSWPSTGMSTTQRQKQKQQRGQEQQEQRPPCQYPPPHNRQRESEEVSMQQDEAFARRLQAEDDRQVRQAMEVPKARAAKAAAAAAAAAAVAAGVGSRDRGGSSISIEGGQQRQVAEDHFLAKRLAERLAAEDRLARVVAARGRGGKGRGGRGRGGGGQGRVRGGEGRGRGKGRGRGARRGGGRRVSDAGGLDWPAEADDFGAEAGYELGRGGRRAGGMGFGLDFFEGDYQDFPGMGVGGMGGGGGGGAADDLQRRDITPEDYERLLALDEKEEKKKAAERSAETAQLISLLPTQVIRPQVGDGSSSGGSTSMGAAGAAAAARGGGGGVGAAGKGGGETSDSNCPVCLCPLEGEVTTLPCLHMFCHGCIAQWLGMGKRTCPVDGEDISIFGGAGD